MQSSIHMALASQLEPGGDAKMRPGWHHERANTASIMIFQAVGKDVSNLFPFKLLNDYTQKTDTIKPFWISDQVPVDAVRPLPLSWKRMGTPIRNSP